jgi:hypothetical protein
MKSFLKNNSSKLIAAALVGLFGASTAQAVLVIDVRATSTSGTGLISPNGKLLTNAKQGDTVTLTAYLQNGNVDLPNGLGQLGMGIRSSGEQFSTNGTTYGAWGGAPAPGNTVVNGTAAALLITNPPIDASRSVGTPNDASGIGNPDTSDTDTDWSGLGGLQSDSPGGDAGADWDPTYGKVAELPLGTFTFTVQTGAQAGAPAATNWAVDLNAYFAGTGGTGGGSVVRSLNTADTNTNGVGATNLLTGAGNFGAPVHVDVAIPEPASLGMLGVAAMGLFGRRRRA